MRAADLMWRMSYPHAERYLANKSPQEIFANVENSTFTLPDEKGFRPLEKQIARIELANTIYFKFQNKASEFLNSNFPEELEQIIDFYS